MLAGLCSKVKNAALNRSSFLGTVPDTGHKQHPGCQWTAFRPFGRGFLQPGAGMQMLMTMSRPIQVNSCSSPRCTNMLNEPSLLSTQPGCAPCMRSVQPTWRPFTRSSCCGWRIGVRDDERQPGAAVDGHHGGGVPEGRRGGVAAGH